MYTEDKPYVSRIIDFNNWMIKGGDRSKQPKPKDRCVELDCHDGDEAQGHEPVIYHGKTMTSKILFRDVIQTCNTNAFIKSPFPVILSLGIYYILSYYDS
jgi:hypothetical protein